jgi:putative colanic acid biosynthesis UDP-glucose lipid carrier transferase
MKKLFAEHTEIVISHPAQVRSIGTFYEFLRPHPLEKKSNLFIKRAFDLFLSFILIVAIFSWMLPLIALLIILDSRGPVFFLQNRIMKGGKNFTCIKFRTMRVNQDADLLPASMNDLRITRTGRFLRRYHLDELPQLLNVFIGDMSITGPRPYMVSDHEKYGTLINQYNTRYEVKPGITGLAQSMGHFGYVHNTGQMEKRVELDLIYIRQWSLALDIKIISRTFLSIIGF